MTNYNDWPINILHDNDTDRRRQPKMKFYHLLESIKICENTQALQLGLDLRSWDLILFRIHKICYGSG
jgi:hypothetical protein